jgi:hypothetical protein
VYEELARAYGDDPSESDTDAFIESYISTNHLNSDDIVQGLQNKWDAISLEYQKRAEKIFGITLPHDVNAYVTVNDRCPYSIENNMFFISISSSIRTAMHELWHFYTWYKYGTVWQEKLGPVKYNEIKEALTVLLNVECAELLPEGEKDYGYAQHQELRTKILETWSKERNMDNLWQMLIA